MSYFPLNVYKLYQSAMPSTAQVKNIFLIIQNLIFLKINISVETLPQYCITDRGRTALSVSGERDSCDKPVTVNHDIVSTSFLGAIIIAIVLFCQKTCVSEHAYYQLVCMIVTSRFQLIIELKKYSTPRHYSLRFPHDAIFICEIQGFTPFALAQHWHTSI